MDEIEKELSLLESDRNVSKMAIDGQRNYYADMLKNTMGQEIKDAMDGKIKLKLPLKRRISDWIKRFL